MTCFCSPETMLALIPAWPSVRWTDWAISAEREVEDVRLWEQLDDEVLVAGDGLDLVDGHVAGEVDVALLQHDLLRGGLGDVADDHALHLGRAVAVPGEGLEHDRLVRLPGLQHEGAGAGVVGLDPGIAEVAVLLVRHDQLLVDHRADAR